MSNLKQFLKGNKKKKENTTFAATQSLLDEKGNPLPWVVRPIDSRKYEELQEKCSYEEQVTGKAGQFRTKLNGTKFINELMVAATVEPDLFNAELQDSYDVKEPSDLLYELLDDPQEYNAYAEFVQKYSGYDKTLQEKVDEAKN